MCWSLMRRLFNLRAFSSNSSETGTTPRTRGSTRKGARKVYGQEILGSNSGETADGEGKRAPTWHERQVLRSESEEFIVMTPLKAKVAGLEIWESKEFEYVFPKSAFCIVGYPRTFIAQIWGPDKP